MELSSVSFRQWHFAVVAALVYCYGTFVFNLLLQKCGLNFCNCIHRTVLDFILSTVFNYYLFQLLQYYKQYEKSVAEASVQVDETENSWKSRNAFEFGQTLDISTSGLCEYLVESSNSEITKEHEHSETPKLSFDLDFSNIHLKPKQNLKRRYSFPLKLSKKFNSNIETPSIELFNDHGRKTGESKLACENKLPQNEVIPLYINEMQKNIKECVEKVCKIERLISKNTDALKNAGNVTENQKDSRDFAANFEDVCLQRINLDLVRTEDFTSSTSTSKLEREFKNAERPSRHSTPLLTDGIHELETKQETSVHKSESLICENCKNEDCEQPADENDQNIDDSINKNDEAKTSDVVKNTSCHDTNKSTSSLDDIETAQDEIEFDIETCPVVQRQPKSLFRFPFKSATLQNMGSPISYSGDHEIDPFTMLHKTMRNFGSIPDERNKYLTEVNSQSDVPPKDTVMPSSGNDSNKISRGVTLNPSDLEKHLKEFPKNLESCLTLLNKKKPVSDQSESKEKTANASLQPSKIDKHKYRSTSLPHLHNKPSNFPKSIVKDRWNDIVSTVSNLMKKYQPQPSTNYPFHPTEHSIFDFTQQNYEEIANGIIVDHPKRRNYLFHLDDEIPTGSAQNVSFGSFIVLDTPKVDKSLKSKTSSLNLSRSNIKTITESVSDDKALESLDLENVSKVYSLISESLGTSVSKSEGSIEENGSFFARLQKSFHKWKSVTKESSTRQCH